MKCASIWKIIFLTKEGVNMLFKQCEFCGANLDPGEKCDCKEKVQELIERYKQNTTVEQDGQISFLEVV